MMHEEFLQLYEQFCKDTSCFSFHKKDHPAYLKLVAAGKDIIPWTLERLQARSGKDYVSGNSPHLAFALLSELTSGKCFDGLPDELRGRVMKMEEFLLAWGEKEGLIK
jgi:hypothetical protein